MSPLAFSVEIMVLTWDIEGELLEFVVCEDS